MTSRCSKGEILRKSHSRKAHMRKSSKSSKNKTTYVSRSNVRASCVQSAGSSRRTSTNTNTSRKLLPKPRITESHLRDFGYKLSDPVAKREEALKRASRKKSSLKILKRLNLIRNITSSNEVENKNRLEHDIKFMSGEYNKSK